MSLISDKLDVHTGLVYASLCNVMHWWYSRRGVPAFLLGLASWPCPSMLGAMGPPPWVRAGEGCGGSGNLHPTASLGQGLVTPGLGLKWGSQLAGIGDPDRRIGALRAPAFRGGSKVSTYLPCTTTLLPLKGGLPWSNSLSTSFSCLRGFSMCLHLCPQKLFSAQCRCFRFM